MILSCKSIKKSYGINLILDNINFHINKGQRVALVGRNGCGKSTLFKIIAGEVSMDSGHCNLAKDTSLGYLSQHLDLNMENSLWDELLHIFSYLIDMENQLRLLEKKISSEDNDLVLSSLMEDYGHLQEEFAERKGYEYPSQIRGVLNGLAFDENDYQKPIKKFSGGQKTRIALGKLLLKQPDILLLDEPTNFLDLETTQWLENYLGDYPNTLFIISHDRYFLDALVDEVLELENGQIRSFKGNYSKYTKHKKERIEVESHQYRQQQKEIKRQEEVIRKLRSFNREKSIKRAESREKLLNKISPLEAPTNQSAITNLNIQPQIDSGYHVLKVKNLSKSFGGHEIFSNISFDVFKGDHIGIIGPNGVGKTTLFNIILNKLSQDSGEFHLGHNVHPAYFDQLQSSLNEGNTILEEVWNSKPSASQTEIRSILGGFLFSEDDVYKAISTLSGGEKSRISLAKLMLSEANFILMDEPTNHIDIPTKEILEDSLVKYRGTLLVISHDRFFLNRVAGKIFEMTDSGIEEFLGNYDYYLEKKDQEKLMEEARKAQRTVNRTQIKQGQRKERQERQALKAQQEKVKSLELKIEELEEKISNLEITMCQPDFYDDIQKSQNINIDYNKSIEKLKEVMENWEENMIILEEM